MISMAFETISKEELKQAMDNGTVDVLNVLSKDYYDKLHIKGSKSIPLAELKEKWETLDKSKTYVTYCAHQQCDASRKAAEFLQDKGFTVNAYEGGIKEWAESGLPVEGSMSREDFLKEMNTPKE